MGTAGGEPRVLLNALKPMLGVVGDIKTQQEVMRVVGMMKDAEKLVSRCVYLNILKATCKLAQVDEEKRETLEKFLATGGWGVLNKWLHEFTKSENFPVLLELIDVLKIMPITVDLLKQGNTGKLIKQMTKLEHSDVKKHAGGLIRQWKDMIRGGAEKKGSENEISDLQPLKKKDAESSVPSEKRLKSKSVDKKVSDSSGFMNALNAAVPITAKKPKRRLSSDSKPNLPLDELLKPASQKKARTEDETERKKVLRNTLASKIRANEQSEANPDAPYVPGPSPAVLAANEALAHDTDTAVVVDEGSLARRKNKKKRNITWAPDESLVLVKYFELLEGERKGHHAENFSLARQHELMLEKQALRAARRSEDHMVEKMKWSRLIPVDNAGVPNFKSGEKSREKFIQDEREKSVLAFIFLTKDSLPDTPVEPDFDPEDHGNHVQPKPIPHDEDGNIFPPKVNNSSKKRNNSLTDDDKSPSVSSNPPATSSNPSSENVTAKENLPDVSPAVQNIMSQLLRNNPFPNEPNNVPNAIATVSGPSSQSQSGGSTSQFSNLGPPPRSNEPGYTPSSIPSILSQNIPNPHGRGNGRYDGGNPGMNRGGFHPRGGGPQQRNRRDGPHQEKGTSQDVDVKNQEKGTSQDVDVKNQPEWSNYNDNGNDHPFNEPFNNNNFHGGGGGGQPPPGPQQFNEQFAGPNRGFHGGNNPRRGGNRGRPDRGRGMMNRGRGRGGGGHNMGRGFDHRQNNEWHPDNDMGHFNNNRGGGRGGRGRDDIICQHFNTPRGCRSGDRCKFKHAR